MFILPFSSNKSKNALKTFARSAFRTYTNIYDGVFPPIDGMKTKCNRKYELMQVKKFLIIFFKKLDLRCLVGFESLLANIVF